MTVHEDHHTFRHPSTMLAAMLTCTVVCAALVGAVTAPFVVVVLGLAVATGAISAHERDVTHRAEPFSVSAAPKVGPLVIHAQHVRGASSTSHSDVA